jgi:hypothetical protein
LWEENEILIILISQVKENLGQGGYKYH